MNERAVGKPSAAAGAHLEMRAGSRGCLPTGIGMEVRVSEETDQEGEEGTEMA